MSFDANCAAVIPCHNEAGAIGGGVASVRSRLPRVIVADDGSTDRTGEIAAAEGAEVVRSPRRRGKGAALRAALRRCAELGADWSLTLDGDGQHDAGDIPRFLAAGERSDTGLIIGDRMAAAARMPHARRVVNTLMSRALSLASGRRLPDTQCGFRLMRLDSQFLGRLTADRFETESDQIVAALELDWNISFVPVACAYRSEQSKIRPLPDAVRWLRWPTSNQSRLAEIRRRGARPDSPALSLSRPAPAHS